MIHYLVAFALLLHVLFWGAGAAMMAMPRPWRRFWPVLVVPAGWALQSAVVWLGAHAGWQGTEAYGTWSLVLPVALLALGLARVGARGRGRTPEPGGAGLRAVRMAWTDFGRFGVVWAAVAGGLAILVLPVAVASHALTTISLGSCDAADYAAGARVLREFARMDRDGFLGLTEVVQLGSVDNFFDYWIRLNHFTPSALIALNGSVLDCAPHELTTLFMAVLLAGTLPLVFWSARAILGYSGGVSVIVAGLFGVSPIMWYGFAHVAPGQLLAAQAVVLLTWCGVALWRGRLTWERGGRFVAVLGLGYWLVLGSYNFFVVLCLVPALTYAAGLALWRRAGARLIRWSVLMLLPLVGTGLLFFERSAGLAERFRLLQTYDFGWRIPALTAEGWLGLVAGPELGAWEAFGLRWILSAAVIGLLGWAVLRGIRQRRPAAWVALALAVPVLAGYLFLQARGARLGTNASYDAYKLFAVFYPLLLPAFCWWVTLRRSRKLHEWLLVAGAGAVVVGGNLYACGLFMWKLSRPPLIVDGGLRQLRQVEAMPDVKSVNVLISDMWSRLWANAFLLRKPQYFSTHTYEGRRDTALRGEWDLEGGLVRVLLPGEARRPLSPRFALVNTRHPAFLRGQIDEASEHHWHAEEHAQGTGERWRWTAGDATVRLQNPHAYPLRIAGAIDGWSPVERAVSLAPAGATPLATVGFTPTRAPRDFPPFEIPPGETMLVIRTQPPAAPVPGDARPLGVGVVHLLITPRP